MKVIGGEGGLSLPPTPQQHALCTACKASPSPLLLLLLWWWWWLPLGLQPRRLARLSELLLLLLLLL